MIRASELVSKCAKVSVNTISIGQPGNEFFFLLQFLHKLGKVFQASNCVNNAKKGRQKIGFHKLLNQLSMSTLIFFSRQYFSVGM